MTQRSRVIVIGAGIGGLTTAALLAKQGYAVTVLEAQTYPGGSASTFYHKGYRFESGATVAGGFQPNGPHAIAGNLLGIEWPVQQHDPAWVVHLPEKEIPLTQDFSAVLDAFPQTAHFWDEQSRIAEIAWSLSAQGLPWPPQDSAEWFQLAKVALQNFPQDVQLAPFALGSVKQWMQLRGVADDPAFVRFIDAMLLIAAQTTSPHVNALYGATAMDLARQGVYHVEGGIGNIAETLVDKIRDLGGEVIYRQRVRRIAIENGKATGVYATKGRRNPEEHFIPADFVVANTTPWSLKKLLADDTPGNLKREVQRREATQGAFVLHLGIEADALPYDIPDHHQIIRSLHRPMGEGETLYISMSPLWDSSRAPDGQRAVTISTHTEISQWWQLLETDEDAYQARKEQFAAEIIAAVDEFLPGFQSGVTLCLPGTPVTYEFYTLRHRGMVGGFPQTSLFKARGPRTGLDNVRLVGDSVFPGQSTAGVTLGGLRVADDIKRHLPVFTGERTVRPVAYPAPSQQTAPSDTSPKNPQKETLYV